MPRSLLSRALFGEADPAALVAAWCAEHLGEAETVTFLAESVGSVYGVRLADGQRAVVKVLRDGRGDFPALQRHLWERGFPCPEPLAGPAPLGSGIAYAESWLEGGPVPDPWRASTRDALAALLARQLALAPPELDLGPAWPRDTWAEPHDLRFDFEATAAGAEWIDEAAERARNAVPELPRVSGHVDWRVEHVRLDPPAVYDWDGSATDSEPVLCAIAAYAYPADWSNPRRRRQVPRAHESRAFLAAFERARGRPFTRDERRAADAALISAAAYGARCEHSDHVLFGEPRPGSSPPGRTPTGTRPPGPASHGFGALLRELI